MCYGLIQFAMDQVGVELTLSLVAWRDSTQRDNFDYDCVDFSEEFKINIALADFSLATPLFVAISDPNFRALPVSGAINHLVTCMGSVFAAPLAARIFPGANKDGE